ncbi:MAG: DUF2182 domain-containing protein [Litorimonas sp.]
MARTDAFVSNPVLLVALRDVGRTLLTRRGLRALSPPVFQLVVLPALVAWAWLVLGTTWLAVAERMAAPPAETPSLFFLDATICRGGRGPGTAMSASPSLAPGQWAVMVVAMMWPTLVPPATYLARRSFRSERLRAVCLFVCAYSVVWALAYPLAWLVLASIEAALSALQAMPWAGALGAAGAAVWQLTPSKRRLLRACHRVPVMGPGGWASDRIMIRFGFDHGLRCAGSCFLLMTLPMVGGHGMGVMIVITALMLAERAAARPDLGASARVLFALAAWQLFSALLA